MKNPASLSVHPPLLAVMYSSIVILFSSFALPNILQAQNHVCADTAVYMNTQTDNLYICPDKQEVYLYVDLQGCSMGKKIPLNLSVVFDRSGSMEGARIHNSKMALDYLIDHMSPEDNLSIVTYDHIAELLHGSEPVTNKEHLKKKVNHIHPRGATNISGGLEKGYQEVLSTYDPNKINKVFLMTDGLANEGITDNYILEKIVKGYSQRNNISISTFGLGDDYNEILLHDLAEAGGGHYYYIEKPSDAISEFGSEITTLLSVVAKNASLTIEFPNEYMNLSRVFGYQYNSYGNMVHIDLKEIHPNEQNGILLKFTLTKNITVPLTFTTSIFYDNLLSNPKRITQQKTNTVSPSPNKEDCGKNVNDKILEKIIYFTSNDLLESAITDAEHNNISSASAKIKKGKALIGNQGQGSPILTKQYHALNEYDNHLSDWNNKDDYQKGVLHKKIRHSNYKLRKLKK